MEEDVRLRTVGAMNKSGKLWIALGGVAVGAALLLLGGRLADDRTETPEPPVSEAQASLADMEAYRQTLEARVCYACTRVEGAGTVTAVVTLETGYEYVYAADSKTSSSGSHSQYVLIGNGGDEQPVYITRRVPVISGIGIVCDGGNDPAVRSEIIGLLSAAFGVKSHKIYVTGS